MKIRGILKKMTVIQPILTLVLIGLTVALVFQFFGKSSAGKNPNYTEISKDLPFETAVNNYFNGSFEVYTRGSLVTKSDASTVLQSSAPTPTINSLAPSGTTIKAVENRYDDHFFFMEKGSVKRLDIRTYGQNESIFYNGKGEIVNMSNTAKAYTVSPIPADTDARAKVLYLSYNNIFQNYFPLVPLLKDYKEGKFNPIKRSTNIYSGKWKHALYTSDEIVDVIVQTEPETGLFRSFIVANSFTTTPSQIYFDFKNYDPKQQLDSIPSDYQKIEGAKK